MRESLINLLKGAIQIEFSLPHDNIPKITVSNLPDDCLKRLTNDEDMARLIYNGIIEYSFEEKEQTYSMESLHSRALLSKLKYNVKDSQEAQIKYGFYGEVLLFLVLRGLYGADTIVSRGHFYDPLENSETKGFDSYHMLEREDGRVEFWFGETKFHDDYYVVNDVLGKISKVLSEDYISRTVYSIDERYDDIKPQSRLKEIIDAWRECPQIHIKDEFNKRDITLVYPILLIFPDKKKEYEDIIKNVVEYINSNYSTLTYTKSISIKIFFMLLPISNSKMIKEKVLTWISEKEPLI